MNWVSEGGGGGGEQVGSPVRPETSRAQTQQSYQGKLELMNTKPDAVPAIPDNKTISQLDIYCQTHICINYVVFYGLIKQYANKDGCLPCWAQLLFYNLQHCQKCPRIYFAKGERKNCW